MTDAMNKQQSAAPRRIAVVGGGVTGLSAAHRLLELARERNTPVEVTLFEASNRTGGVFGTLQMAGYLVETGADSFITNKPWAVDLCRRLGLEERLIPTDARYRRSLVLRKGKPVAVPDGFLLLTPARLGPVLSSPLFNIFGKLRMGLEYFIPRRKGGGDESLGSFVKRRFGRQALYRLVQPLVGGIYTSDPWKLSLEATMPRFLEMEREHGSLLKAMRRAAKQPRPAEETNATGARYGLFATLKGGMSELLTALEQRVSQGGIIRRGVAVTRVRPIVQEGQGGAPGKSRWELSFADGSQDAFDGVILTTRAPLIARMIESFDAELAKPLSQIEYASSAIIVSGHKLSDIEHPLDAFGLVVPYIERRKILAVSFTSRKFPDRAPDGHVQLRTFLGGAMQPELLYRSDEDLMEITRRELRQILGVKGKEEFAIVCRYNEAMPQYHVGHVAKVRQIEKLAEKHQGLELAGNAYHGVGVPDCIHSGEQAAERMMGLKNPK